jgi:hypothetical protein
MVAVHSPITNIMTVYINKSTLAGAQQDARIQIRIKDIREQRKNLESNHRLRWV